MEESREVPEKICLDGTVICPIQHAPHAMEKTVAMSGHAYDTEPFSGGAVADVVEVPCVHGWSRIIRLADSAISRAQEGPIVR